ncbi:MAG TPA: glutamate mutase L [Kofleriaceae bacterium]|nr:glutamate mutase L [Kofleriaceae bacterium]
MAKHDDIDPATITSVIATDCGSTTTKAILIEKNEAGEYRLKTRGEAPTTVEAPVEDVTRGVLNAVREVEELRGRQLLADDRIITPRTGDRGTDIYISTSSAGGGLQMMVAGVVKKMTAESAARAALGAGAIVMDTVATNDRRLPHEKIERIRHLRPDMILLAGGTDGGTVKHVVALAELLAAAQPRPRLGSAYNLPVIYAGNIEVREQIDRMLGQKVALQHVANVRPILEAENLGPARDAIHDQFMEHVMAQAPGYSKLMEWTDVPIMPTPGAMGLIIKALGERDGVNVVGVDIGGATTDVFSVFDGTFNRTVSANLGMSYSVSNVLAEAGIAAIQRWLPFDLEEHTLRDRIGNKMIRPTTIPQSLEELKIEQAIAREALRLAFIQHKQFAVKLRGVQTERTIADAFNQSGGGNTLVDMMKLDLVVGSGGVLSHAPRRSQSAMMLIDAFEVAGVTELAVDSIFMMPHLGVLSTVHPAAATEVFEKDCLIRLGTCIAPVGRPRGNRPLCEVSLAAAGGSVNETLAVGDLRTVPLEPGATAKITLTPSPGVDVGAGPGTPLETEVRGGISGLIFDGRLRPLKLPEERGPRVQMASRWSNQMELYPEAERAPASAAGTAMAEAV